jgi:P63C domain
MDLTEREKRAAKAFARLGGLKGGKARAEALTPEERQEIARQAATARWTKMKEQSERGTKEEDKEAVIEYLPPEALSQAALPVAKVKGFLNLLDMEIPCYVLDPTDQRVVGRTATTEMLTGIKGGGDLEKYLGVKPLKPFINLENVLERMVSFRLPEVEGLDREVKGLPADLVIEICRGFVSALDASMRPGSEYQKLTPRQTEMALKAGMFLAACAKVGLDALIDEATGYQYIRAHDALEIKLRAYLAEAMRKWERTFPDELWIEFGRLTNWRGSVTQRPKSWGKLVMELVYEYLDPDVAQWLRENAPKPRHGQNYHQWLSAQYGLRKLTEHIWKLIGIGSTCQDIGELKYKMAEMYGKAPLQYVLSLHSSDEKDNDTR